MRYNVDRVALCSGLRGAVRADSAPLGRAPQPHPLNGIIMTSQHEVDLSILDPDASKSFLDYFMAELRGLRTGLPFLSGRAGFIDNNTYETVLERTSNIIESAEVDLKLYQKTDGTIKNVIFSKTDCTELNEGEKEKLTKFVNVVLQKCLSKSQSIYEFRHIFSYYGPDLSGEYWISGYRFSPLIQEKEEERYILNTQRLVVIDQKVSGIDNQHAELIANRRTHEFIALLSLILDLAITTLPSQSVYTFDFESISSTVKRRHIGYFHDKPFLKIPNKGEEMSLGAYSGSIYDDPVWRFAGHLICMPQESRKIIKYILNSPLGVKKAYLNCSKLYRLGLIFREHSKTAALSYMVAAVDALNQGLGQEASFSEFLKKYGGNVSDEMTDFLYRDVRSAHIHAGEFLLEDYSIRSDLLVDFDRHILRSAERSAHELIRKTIFNSVMQKLKEDEESV